MKLLIRQLWRDNQGQDLVEYALAAGMIALTAVASVPQLSTVMNTVFNSIGGIVQNNIP